MISQDVIELMLDNARKVMGRMEKDGASAYLKATI